MTVLSVFSAIGNVWSSVWPYLTAILLFLFMIFIHEFGHFLSAKLLGVKVNEFAIGFGPTLFKKRGKETLYAVRAVPFGGFCAMEGEDEESGDGRAFCNKKAWRRLIIVVAGAFMNLVLGLLLVTATTAHDAQIVTTRVHSFRTENAVSEASGLLPGDEIIRVNGRRIYSTVDLSYCLTNVEGDTLEMQVKRDGKTEDLNVKFNSNVQDGINYVEIDFFLTAEKKTVGNVLVSSFKTTLSYGRVVWFSLVDLLTGKYGISAMSGPVGVTAAIGQVAKRGIWDLIPMISLITINLGVFNLLPVPALDGGRAFFILVEMIIRRPVPKKAEGMVHAVGLLLLLALIAVITVKDIIGFF